MFEIGILIGIYGYLILLLGFLGLLYFQVLSVLNVAFIAISVFLIIRNVDSLKKFKRVIDTKDKLSLILLFVLFIQVLVNLIGALGPELGFDALWYHLTIPKMYLNNHAITYIPGSLLFYSGMPKFLELLYTGGLAFGSYVFPKLIHFGFGIAILFVLYKISRRFFPRRGSLFVLIIFYSNLVVGWESISAYVDLGRTFFELISFLAFLEWIENRKQKYLYYSSIFIGIAIMTKLLAVGSFFTLSVFLLLSLRRLKDIFIYIFLAILSPLPWFIFSFIHTGDPIYPFFSSVYPVYFLPQLLNPFYFAKSFWTLLLYSPDPLNPIYLCLLPIIIINFRRLAEKLKFVFFYTVLGVIWWYITPPTGGGRFIIPYLPFFSIISMGSILLIKSNIIRNFLFATIIVIAISSVFYRSLANAKFIPVLINNVSEAKFLTNHLNFSYGDFYDTDSYFKKNIKPTDRVLLYGFHNLFYVDFPFIDASFVKKGDRFNYIVVQNTDLPERFKIWKKIYENPLTRVSLFSKGGNIWTY